MPEKRLPYNGRWRNSSLRCLAILNNLIREFRALLLTES